MTRWALPTLPVRRGRPGTFSSQDAADLCGRLAEMSRAGLPAHRAWQLLAVGGGPAGRVAAIVAGMHGAGGRDAEGLRMAADRCDGSGIEALSWLAVTADVIDRTGAPTADLLDEVAGGLLAQLAAIQELEAALAGPRASAAVLRALPLAGVGLALLLGADPLGLLLHNQLGRGCAGAGLVLWYAGGRWSRRLIAAAVPGGL